MRRKSLFAANLLLYGFACNCVYLLKGHYGWLFLLIPAALAVNVLAGAFDKSIPGRRLRLCSHGTECLVIFCVTLLLSAGWHLWLGFTLIPGKTALFLGSAAVCVGLELVLFWNGIISVYCTSVQLGIRTRVIGVLLGWVPVVNLIVLARIVSVCGNELRFETKKHEQNLARKDERVCGTKYPILLVHGVFFRDFKRLNYWGRIPAELTANGACVYYGEHSSASSVADSAAELTARIRQIVAETGCGKVNIIAHSKGGLDCRAAIAGEAGAYVASLTTINTPHRGCGFADYLLEKVPAGTKEKIEKTYNAAARKLGDPQPDFMAAVTDLTAERCGRFDEEHPAPAAIYCRSVGSVLKRARGGKFPLNFSYRLVKYFDGENDGLVAEDSFRWGETYTLLRPAHRRGISHGDMIDLNRENIRDFDVREFYVGLVAQLKERGL
ncbi:MAG: esterase/lipase family protein [Oscillospiraceae bacterium]